jgi:hypothetical protein
MTYKSLIECRCGILIIESQYSIGEFFLMPQPGRKNICDDTALAGKSDPRHKVIFYFRYNKITKYT